MNIVIFTKADALIVVSASMVDVNFVRGEIYYAKLPGIHEPKFFVVVSSNPRNRAPGTCLAVRVTTTQKRERPSVVPVPHGEAIQGSVLCDDIVELFPEDISAQDKWDDFWHYEAD